MPPFVGLDHERTPEDTGDDDEYLPPSNDSRPLVRAVRLGATRGGRLAR